MAGTGRRRSISSAISTGKCIVEVEKGRAVCDPTVKEIILPATNNARVGISGTEKSNLVDYTFVLLNPKDADSRSKSMLQETLQIYSKELPSMNYAANTGKASKFLERCLFSGKYNTLVLGSNSFEGSAKVIAAVTFQIIPVDTQFAEIPLAVVSSHFQRKGIGSMMCEELKERLASVGISAIFCWADLESEQFWLKQGYITVGVVDGKGKARKLPVRADIKRALCFPGDATLMIAHLKRDSVTHMNSSQYVQTSFSSKANTAICRYDKLYRPEAGEISNFKNLSAKASDKGDFGDVAGNTCLADERISPTLIRGKRLVWEASFSSLKSKRVKGSHVADDSVGSDPNCYILYDKGNYACSNENSMTSLGCQSSKENPNSITHYSNLKSHSLGEGLALERAVQGVEGNCPRILFMNIADNDKKSKLTMIVEELGGSVTSCGSSSTHVITGKARRTLNFCLSLCSGTWIVSASWLKSSFREGKFLDESQYILEDEDYWLKYKCQLRDAVSRAKENPHSLLRGYQVCISKHIQPSTSDLSSIIISAGGSVISDLQSVSDLSKTIFLACEEDMERALLAAKMGVRTFNSEWFMNCVMRQELDLEAHQFAESL